MQLWKNKLKVIAWDLDGTLYPNNPQLSAAIEEAKLQLVAATLGVSFLVATQQFSQLYSKLNSNTKVLQQLGINGEEFFVQLWQKLDLDKYIQPNSQLAVALAKLSANKNLRQIIITNSNNQQTVQKKLACLNIDSSIFTSIYTSVATGFLKPDPRIFSHVLQQEQIKPSDMVYVGDRPATDILPAYKLGINVIYVSNQSPEFSYVSKEELPQATRVFANALEAAKWLLAD